MRRATGSGAMSVTARRGGARLVFENRIEISRVDLARLSDVGGEMISSLASHEDLGRKLLRRVA